MKAKLVRFGVSMDENLLKRFDALVSHKGYANRSEALRDLVRNYLVEERWTENKDEMVGVITVVYNHHTRGLSDSLTELQHHFHDLIISTMHLHMDEDNCLEVLVVKGMAEALRVAADKLISTRGVKHGRLIPTSTGRELT